MDDVKTKREARRRKILENSEKRLQKITHCKLEENYNDSTNFSSNIGKETISREQAEAEVKSVNELINTTSNNTDEFISEKNFSLPEEVSKDITTSNTNKINRIRIPDRIWQKLGFKLSILAIIVRIVHIFKFGYLFGETIVIPFALFMMTQLGSCQFDQNVAGITGPILFFIGMSPNKIKNLLICYNVVTSILVYFAIYFFSFVCAHLTFVMVFEL